MDRSEVPELVQRDLARDDCRLEPKKAQRNKGEPL